MSGAGLPTFGTIDATGLSVAVVSSTWNVEITDILHEHAIAKAKELGASVYDMRVVGALEIPVVVAKLAPHFDAVVATGCVVKGGTPHFDYVCDSVTEGLTRIALDSGTPIGNGVLTTNTLQQARERSGVEGASEDKGADAMFAALHTALTLKKIDTDLKSNNVDGIDAR